MGISFVTYDYKFNHLVIVSYFTVSFTCVAEASKSQTMKSGTMCGISTVDFYILDGFFLYRGLFYACTSQKLLCIKTDWLQ